MIQKGVSILGCMALCGLVPVTGVAQAHHAEAVEGEALVQISADGWVRVAVDSLDEAGTLDGLVDRVFFAQVPELDSLGLERRWSDVHIEWTRDSLLLREHGSGEELRLWVPGGIDEEGTVRHDRRQAAQSLANYGAASWQVSLADLESAPFPDSDKIFQQSPDLGGGSGSVSCSAGGPGATSCSLSQGDQSCAVSCSAPNYACCYFGPLTCKCQS